MVTDIGDGYVQLEGSEQSERIATSTVLWAAGVQASPLAKHLAEQTAAEIDRQGRVIVKPDLSLPGASEVFVLGDMAHVRGPEGDPLPGVAPVAIQQGQYVARLIRNRLKNKAMPAFRYKDRGNMAVIGRSAAVAQVGKFRFGGYFAWLLWLFIHLIFIVEFQNRLLVLMQWGWNYFTRNRSARLITPDEPLVVAKNTSQPADTAAL
jgi:NADH dehydrogenase